MNIPQIKGSVVTNQAESHVALAAVHIDFSLFKVQPPSEYLDVGHSLSARRRNEADEGQSHLTAAQLGVLFGSIAPKAPNLIRAYGLRCSEIANSPTFNPRGNTQHGLFANDIGADGTAVWAAATSGDSAIAVHLLGCMLSCIWSPPEAISIWVQLIAERKEALASSGNPVEFALSQNISVTREQIASWHTSIQAWRRTADDANARRQSQLLLILNNLGIPVNQKLSVSESVLEAWATAMVTVDNLVSGKPQSVQTGAPLLGLSAWHLYPNMIVFGQGKSSKPAEVVQNDSCIERGGILTLGIQDLRRIGEGIYWSLPLVFLRYYGQPVRSEAQLSARTSRASFDDLIYVAMGSLVRRWLAHASDIENAAKFLVAIHHFTDLAMNVGRESNWMCLIANAAEAYLAAELEAKTEKLQLIKCGRRRYPLFVDDPASDPIFGLSNPSTLLRLLPGNEARVKLLRHVAQDFSDNQGLMIVQCKCGSLNQYELASVAHLRERSCYNPEWNCGIPPRRYVRWLNRSYKSLQPPGRWEWEGTDSRCLDSPIPPFYTPDELQWRNPPRSFYEPLLEGKCGDSKCLPDWLDARGVTVTTAFVFGDPEVAALYSVSIHYWTSFSPNYAPKIIGNPHYRSLPNIVVIRQVLWALEKKILDRGLLCEYLVEGRFSYKIMMSLKALQTAFSLYQGLHNATVELKTAEQPLWEHQWIPSEEQRCHPYHSSGFVLNREQMFACISKFDSGTFNFHPSAMNGVLAISSGNSLYVASCLLQDPCTRRPPSAIERVVGNFGKPGMALLVCPAVPQVRPLSDDVRLVNHHPFRGNEEDCFGQTSLHLSFTEWQLPIDVGSRGNRDVEGCYVEAAVGVYDRGKWVADLNILDIFKHRLSRIIPGCTQRHEALITADEASRYVTIDSWEELLDSPTEIGVVRARGNWQARLAAAALSIQRGHETRIIPEKACWQCCSDLQIMPCLDMNGEEDTHMYNDSFGVVPWVSDDEGSDSETDEIVNAALEEKGRKENGIRPRKDRVSTDTSLNRNIIYIL